MSEHYTLHLILHCLLIHSAIAIAVIALLELIWQTAIKIVYGENVQWEQEDHIEWLLCALAAGIIPVLGEYMFGWILWTYASKVESWAYKFYSRYWVQDNLMCRKEPHEYWWKQTGKQDNEE